MDSKQEFRRLRNVLQKGLQQLDVLEKAYEERTALAPKGKKRKFSLRQELEHNAELGIWRKPTGLIKSKHK
ncbi:MAG: hypothetical protein BGO55_00785 [Sphingobacteriales bacterium 50-39]|nr:hypothetical protein [Sphingobacteriales bacterium]OJW53650.1 MAG: hypothetical protein BGO55_00785 [Sphingobacteriales bacterium 50-39]